MLSLQSGSFSFFSTQNELAEYILRTCLPHPSWQNYMSFAKKNFRLMTTVKTGEKPKMIKKKVHFPLGN
jgi:hypothetical protein